MPVTGVTDPAAFLTQRMGPAVQPGGQPGGGPAGATAGGADPLMRALTGGGPAGGLDPESMAMAQTAQRLLSQQRGTEYLQKYLRRLSQMIKSALASNFLQNPQAEADMTSAMVKLNTATEKLGKAAVNAPAISSAVAELTGGRQGGPGAPQSPQRMSGGAPYPLAA